MKRISTTNKILFSYILIVLIMVLFVGVAILPSQIQEMEQTLENSISETASLLSGDETIKNGIAKGVLSDTSVQRLDSLVQSNEHIDFIVIANTESTRLYHPDHSLIGQQFTGGDEKQILSNEQAYITIKKGNTDTQKRAFHQIKDTDGNVLGFIMVSASLTTIHAKRLQIFLHLLVVLLLILFIGILFSVLLSRSIRKALLGYEPGTFAQMYLRREEILDTLEDSILAVTNTGQYLYRNPVAKEFFPEDLNLFHTILSSPLKTCFEEQTTTNQLMVELNDNTFLMKLIPLVRMKHCDGVLVIARNKTDVTQMAEQLTGMNHILDALRANTHEFMNKLHVISGLLQIGETAQALDYINENATEIECGHRTVIRQIQNRTIAALILGKQNRAKELNICFSLQKESNLEPHNPFLSSKELVTIIGNLTENAFEALKDTSDPREVDLMIRSDQSGLTITVDDTGCGMSDEQIHCIYEGQYTSKGSGHGYGLRLIQEIVHSHSGFFTIESELGEGTSISIIFNKKRTLKQTNK